MLECVELSVAYHGVPALRRASLAVLPGEIVALLGSNGAGKTTLFKALAGLLSASGGRILMDGHDIAKIPAYQRARLGLRLVPEGRRLFPELTVRENLLSASRADQVAEGEAIDRVHRLFPILSGRQHQLAGSLSGGEQQMVAIGRALIASPRVLLLDEPSLGMAPRVVHEVFVAIAALPHSGIAVLLAEQNLRAALRIASRGYVLRTGEIVFAGTASELQSRQDLPELYWGKLTAEPL